jgi:hypothetical protein
MKCAVFESWQNDLITEAVFKKHMHECRSCRMQYDKDNDMLQHLAALRTTTPVPQQWPAIEAALLAEKRRSRLQAWGMAARAAAVFVMVVGLGAGISFRPGDDSAGLLSDHAVQNAQAREIWYEHSIREMERRFITLAPAINSGTTTRFQNRLRTLDQHVERCRAARLENPANARIQQSLLNALMEKQRTLQHMIQTRRQMPVRPEMHRRIS